MSNDATYLHVNKLGRCYSYGAPYKIIPMLFVQLALDCIKV